MSPSVPDRAVALPLSTTTASFLTSSTALSLPSRLLDRRTDTVDGSASGDSTYRQASSSRGACTPALILPPNTSLRRPRSPGATRRGPGPCHSTKCSHGNAF
ncbi:ethylene-responsive transcription factor 1-like [Iris pallida]|uniref:Ethylene-responsive transcription factor 1-like n=1 Tax=Iris pallida TaxID=29817 RepID=A0AAX6FN97_IRIPA|nr:ethylene-responsive transcription factor 1-like [Iris pallida]